MDTYFETNRDYWNARIDVHMKSPMYNMTAFRHGASSLKEIELGMLGSVKGKKILHLQCHFGQDTLSLARMGAEVTGIDLSDRAIQSAKKLSKELNLPARFVCGNVLSSCEIISEDFDIIFTSYGVLGWLPDLDPWAKVIHQLLRPGGSFVLVEFHPVMYMFDDALQYVQYAYFNQGVSIEETRGSYAEPDADLSMEECFWNHSLSDVFTPLYDTGMEITEFSEYDYSPWDCFAHTVPCDNGYQIEGMEGKLPMVFAIKASKPPC